MSNSGHSCSSICSPCPFPILVPGVTAEDVTFERRGNDLIVGLSDGSSVRIGVDGFRDGRLSKITFANGTDTDILLSGILPNLPVQGTENDENLQGSQLADIIHGNGGHDVINGGAGDDILYGEDGNDILHGEAGNDILDGGEGNDTLKGGAGNDTYIFGRGYDQDVISDTEGENILHITQADYDNLWLQREGNDLKVSILGTEDSVTVSAWYSSENAGGMDIQTDTRIIGKTDVDLLVQAMSSFSQPNTGALSQDATLSGGLRETVSRLWQART